MTCIAICGGGLTVLFGFGMKPVSIPPGKATQGSVKADWVAVWFCDINSKMTISPTFALIVSGV
jgi:hypothetical protein